MKWKEFRPFILELFMFTVILSMLFIAVIRDSITIRWSVLSVLFIIFLTLWTVQYVFTFVLRSIFALIDCITNSYDTIAAEFVQQVVFRSSALLDKNGTYEKGCGVRTIETVYYKIIVRTKTGIDVLTSSKFYELSSNAKYRIVFGHKSKIVVSITKIDDTEDKGTAPLS